MATSKLNLSDRILVRGIPSTINADKLIIHFQRRKTGGGDVKSVTFPLSSKEPDTAIVIFEDPATVETVLQKDHILVGKNLVVTALETQPQIFESIVATISSFVLQKIKSSNEDIDEVFENISDATGSIIEQTKEGYQVRGEWYQLQATLDMLEGTLSGGMEKSAPPTPTPSLNGYLSSETAPKPPPASPAPARKVVSTIIDKDTYAYMEKVHKSDLEGIEKQFMVDFKATQIGGDATKVEVAPITSTSDTQKAVKHLQEMHQSIQSNAGQEVIDIDPNMEASAVDNILTTMLLPEFPDVHMGRVDASPNQIIIVAPNMDKCRMAADMLKHYFTPASTQPPKKVETRSENQIDVDKDIFQYMMLDNGPTLERIWDSYGAKIEVSTIGDCSKIEVVKKPSKLPFRPQDAIDHFQKIYNRVNETACQEVYDLGKLKKPVSNEKLADVIKTLSKFHKAVHLSQLNDDKDQVLFIADTEENCSSAMALFGQLLETPK